VSGVDRDPLTPE